MGEATGDCHGWGDGFGLRASLRVPNPRLHRLHEPPRIRTLSTDYVHGQAIQHANRNGRGVSSNGRSGGPSFHPKSVVESMRKWGQFLILIHKAPKATLPSWSAS